MILRHRIISASAPGMASEQPFDSQIKTFYGTVFFSACTAYSEQVGVYLHEAGVIGEIQYL